MALTSSALQALTQGSDADAWRVIVEQAVEIARKPLDAGNAPSEVVRRDREIGALDLFLSSSGWDLWQAFGDSVERTSDRLVRWWAEPFSAKAVLILDGLSLRELPWLSYTTPLWAAWHRVNLRPLVETFRKVLTEPEG